MRLRRRDMFLFAVMLTICVAACAAVFRSAAGRRAVIAADIATKQTLIADVQRSTEGVERLQDKIDQLQSTVEVFDRSLPRQEELPTLLAGVKSLASDYAVKADQVVALSASPAGDFVEQTIQLNVTGRFEDFYSFLIHVEKQPGQPRVARMQLSKSANTTIVHADILLGVLMRPAEAKAPSTVADSLDSSLIDDASPESEKNP